jgi:hypothetical protein
MIQKSYQRSKKIIDDPKKVINNNICRSKIFFRLQSKKFIADKFSDNS